MSRTRITFFVVLALFLVLIAVGISAQPASTRLLQQFFIAATVFAGGVVLLDFLGILGGHHGDTGNIDIAPAHGGHDLAADASHGADLTGHDVAMDHGGISDHAGGHDTLAHVGAADHGHDAAQTTHDSAPGHAHDAVQNAAAPVLSALTYLRLFVYFCLGFGPAGWAAMATGRSALASLAIASLFGFGALFLAQAFFRFQRQDTDSQLERDELVSQEATVIVALDDHTMGKVRVTVGLNVADLYALAADPGQAFDKGSAVRIADVTDECVYVR